MFGPLKENSFGGIRISQLGKCQKKVVTIANPLMIGEKLW